MTKKLPAWFKQQIPDAEVKGRIKLLGELNVNTVCSHAGCPNLSFCFKNLKFTFLILGDTCTRNCRFCGVGKSKGKKLTLDENEPNRVSQAVEMLNLKFAVITSVTRDDLADKGAAHFSRTIRMIRQKDKSTEVEALIPDFSGDITGLKCVIDSEPSILAHNLETVRRLYGDLRPEADYDSSLRILKEAKEINPSLITKSSLILGMGEAEDEVIYAMEDLRSSGCDILTLGQYLAPTEKHHPVAEFVEEEQFDEYRRLGLGFGFKEVLSGPKVRSSYQAEKVFQGLKNV
ncbi:MAG: lipoyl synthase [Candidatus Omnitrophica bacterium]|nr:lipoyl synthase [Candidatus Omnitrophota bacterium]MDD5553905.1 lipoyl synthase [Candidatus Omnitrophota bacterium]